MVPSQEVRICCLNFFDINNSFDLDVSKALFKAVDRNGNGELDLPDVMALAAIVNKLVGRFGAQGVNQQAQSSQ